MATFQGYDELDSDMVDEVLDDLTVEQLLAGRHDGERDDLHALSSFITTLRSASTTAPVAARPELVAIFETGLAPGEVSPVAGHPKSHTSRRRRMLETLSAFVATLAGKVVLGTAAVAASVGGAHAAGVVDVPVLPERAPATVVETPAGEDARDHADSRPAVETGRPDDPGVDGSSVAERATSGEPREDGKAFGTSIAGEATDGTPAAGRSGNPRGIARNQQPDAPAGSPDNADQHKPDDAPTAGTGTADQYRPDATGGADTADDHRPDSTRTGRP